MAGSIMLFAHFTPVPGKRQGRKAALVPAQLGVPFPRRIWRRVRRGRARWAGVPQDVGEGAACP